MKEDIFKEVLNVSTFNGIVEKFHNSIIDTNRGHKFFVDWDKVEKKVNKLKIELNILNSLVGSRDFENDLIKILREYPEVLPAIPILIAVRYLRFRVIKDFLDKDSDIINYDFSKRELTEEDINKFILFFEKTGLKHFFENLSQKNLIDYITGVEVGMDTHARKNRSGKAMELVIEPILFQICDSIPQSYDILTQKYFRFLEKKYDITVGESLKNRKSDFLLVSEGKKVINIEVNFYKGTGSKPQEIVNSYINRQNDLKENRFNFIWITDGGGDHFLKGVAMPTYEYSCSNPRCCSQLPPPKLSFGRGLNREV